MKLAKIAHSAGVFPACLLVGHLDGSRQDLCSWQHRLNLSALRAGSYRFQTREAANSLLANRRAATCRLLACIWHSRALEVYAERQ